MKDYEIDGEKLARLEIVAEVYDLAVRAGYERSHVTVHLLGAIAKGTQVGLAGSPFRRALAAHFRAKGRLSEIQRYTGTL